MRVYVRVRLCARALACGFCARVCGSFCLRARKQKEPYYWWQLCYWWRRRKIEPQASNSFVGSDKGVFRGRTSEFVSANVGFASRKRSTAMRFSAVLSRTTWLTKKKERFCPAFVSLLIVPCSVPCSPHSKQVVSTSEENCKAAQRHHSSPPKNRALKMGQIMNTRQVNLVRKH